MTRVADPLLDLFGKCVVRIDRDGRFAGSGFCVAPGEVLTCAHVVHGATAISVQTTDGARFVAHPISELLDKGDERARRFYPQPDAVLLRVEGIPVGHPCVQLEAADPAVHDALQLTAYTEGENAPGRVDRSGATLYLESLYFEDSSSLYKLRAGQVIQGFSGGPLLNMRTGKVCALVDSSRSTTTDLGGFGVPVAMIARDVDCGLLARNTAFHATDHRWEEAKDDQRSAAAKRAEPAPRRGLGRGYLYRDLARRRAVEVAPDRLEGRERDLSKLARSGPRDCFWLVGGPWSGKTALLSWLCLHPPEDTVVVSFFLHSGSPEESDSEAFLDGFLRQLTELLDPPREGADDATARVPRLHLLIEEVSARCRAQGKRLLLLVDGLDEDASPARGMQSVASMLPKKIPESCRLIAGSRAHPPLPDDVPDDHPLRRSRLPLDPSPRARVEESRAKGELRSLLAKDANPLIRDILGLMVASDGGLTVKDLAELLDRKELVPLDISGLLDGALGRTIADRSALTELPVAQIANADHDHYFVFAHDTLRDLASDGLGTAVVARCWTRIERWIDEYRRGGWPPGTPRYVLRGYVARLAREGAFDRLVRHVSDPTLREQVFLHSGGHALHLHSLAVARAAATEHPPRIAELLWLTRLREMPTTRDTSGLGEADVLARLAGGWLALGEWQRALALVGGIANPEQRWKVISDRRLVKQLLDTTTDRETVRRMLAVGEDARLQTERYRRGSGHSHGWLVQGWIELGDIDEAERLAWAGSLGFQRTSALLSVVRVLVRDDLARAESLVADMEESLGNEQASGLTVADVVTAWIVVGNTDRAERFSGSIEAPDVRARAFGTLVIEAGELITDSERERAAVEAREAADRVEAPLERVRALGDLTRRLGAAGYKALAATCADAAEHALVDITDPGEAEDARYDLVVRLSGGGEDQRALDLASAFTGPEKAADAVNVLTERGTENSYSSGLREFALAVAARLDEQDGHAPRQRDSGATWDSWSHRSRLAESLAALAEIETATTVAVSISDDFHRTKAAGSIMLALIRAGDRDQADRLVLAAEGNLRDAMREKLTEVLGREGHTEEAIKVAHSIESKWQKSSALTSLFHIQVRRGEFESAEALLPEESLERSDYLSWLFCAMAEGGNDRTKTERIGHRAELALLREQETYRDDASVARLVVELVRAGEFRSAIGVVRGIVDTNVRQTALVNAAREAQEAGSETWAVAFARGLPRSLQADQVWVRLVRTARTDVAADQALEQICKAETRDALLHELFVESLDSGRTARVRELLSRMSQGPRQHALEAARVHFASAEEMIQHLDVECRTWPSYRLIRGEVTLPADQVRDRVKARLRALPDESVTDLLGHPASNPAVAAMVHEIRGSFEHAERCAHSPHWPQSRDFNERIALDRDRHLARIGAAAAKAGATEVAVRILGDARLTAYDRVDVLTPLVEWTTRRGDLVAAEDFLEQIREFGSDRGYRYWPLRVSMCRRAIELDDQPHAERLITRRRGEDHVDTVLAAFAVEMAERGEMNRAEQAIRTIHTVHVKAHALAGMAAVLARRYPKSMRETGANALLAEAIDVSWSHTLASVREIDPRLLVQLAALLGAEEGIRSV